MDDEHLDTVSYLVQHMASRTEKQRSDASETAYDLYEEVGSVEYKRMIIAEMKSALRHGTFVGLGNMTRGTTDKRFQKKYNQLIVNTLMPRFIEYVERNMEPEDLLGVVLMKPEVVRLPKLRRKDDRMQLRVRRLRRMDVVEEDEEEDELELEDSSSSEESSIEILAPDAQNSSSEEELSYDEDSDDVFESVLFPERNVAKKRKRS